MNLLTLSTFPFDKPRHGGQQRLSSIVKKYKSLGHVVQSIGVLGSRIYDNQAGFLSCPADDVLSEQVKNTLFMEDLAIGRLFASSDDYFSRLANNISVTPDVIHVELPWLFDFALRYRKMIGKKEIKIIYGSENIEHKLKYALLRPHLPEIDAAGASDQALQCELSAIKNADAICCVSQQDLEWTKQFTAARCVVASNGVNQREVTVAGIQSASRITDNKKFALYCASGYPPNVTGFFDIFGAGLGSIAPDQLLVVAGSAGPSIQSHRLASRIAGITSKLRVVGEVDEPTLQGLLNAAHVIVLPITQGEGTNLKTAEALWAKKYIVATTKAMRGFEPFTRAQGLFVNDRPSDFLQSLQTAMSAAPCDKKVQESPSREAVLWEHTLRSLPDLLKLPGRP